MSIVESLRSITADAKVGLEKDGQELAQTVIAEVFDFAIKAAQEGNEYVWVRMPKVSNKQKLRWCEAFVVDELQKQGFKVHMDEWRENELRISWEPKSWWEKLWGF